MEEAGTPNPAPNPTPTPTRQPWTGNRNAVVAVVALVAIIAIGLVLFFVLHKSKTGTKSVLGVGPLAFKTVGGLKAQALKYNAHFYWAGPQPGVRYGFQRTTTDNIFVRYLPKGVSVNDKSTGVLTISTYPLGAYASLKKKATATAGPNGSIIWIDPKARTSVYMAWKNKNVEVEVYDPSPRLAKLIAHSGKIKPIQ